MLQISILLKMHSSGSESDNEGTRNVHNEMQFISEHVSADPCASPEFIDWCL